MFLCVSETQAKRWPGFHVLS